MRRLAILAVILFAAVSGFAQGKACEELKGEITKKLDDKQVKGYTLEIVDKDKQTEAATVGTCEGGSKKIVYSKAAAAQPQAPSGVKATGK